VLAELPLPVGWYSGGPIATAATATAVSEVKAFPDGTYPTIASKAAVSHESIALSSSVVVPRLATNHGTNSLANGSSSASAATSGSGGVHLCTAALAPEVLQVAAYDAAADIFGIGASLIQLIHCGVEMTRAGIHGSGVVGVATPPTRTCWGNWQSMRTADVADASIGASCLSGVEPAVASFVVSCLRADATARPQLLELATHPFIQGALAPLTSTTSALRVKRTFANAQQQHHRSKRKRFATRKRRAETSAGGGGANGNRNPTVDILDDDEASGELNDDDEETSNVNRTSQLLQLGELLLQRKQAMDALAASGMGLGVGAGVDALSDDGGQSVGGLVGALSAGGGAFANNPAAKVLIALAARRMLLAEAGQDSDATEDEESDGDDELAHHNPTESEEEDEDDDEGSGDDGVTEEEDENDD
jgi:hypothetical protein